MLDLFKRKSTDEEKKPWSERLTAGLARSREKLTGALTGVFARRKLDEQTLEELETALLTADVGVAATQQLLEDLRARWKRAGADEDPKDHLKAALLDLIAPLEKPLVITRARPFVIMLAGVNGAGKTTSIGKLARLFQGLGHSVLLAAGDTFRAAAREQLEVWGARNGVTVISQAGGDPGAVMFDAMAAAKARGIDVVLADTAGRLPTQLQLMEEIRKVQRVIRKADATATKRCSCSMQHRPEHPRAGQAFDDALGADQPGPTKPMAAPRGGVVLSPGRPSAAVHRGRPGSGGPEALCRRGIRRCLGGLVRAESASS